MDRVGDSVCRIAYRRHDTHDHDFTVVAPTLAACNSGRVVRVLRLPLLWILLAYYLLSAVTLVAWDARGVYLPTGDEPHYLVIADALVADRSLDVSTAYRREIDEPRWFASGLADPGSPLAPPAAHVVTTDTGVFSWHGVGVGAFVAAPSAVAGISGARIVMTVVSSLGICLAWLLAGQFLRSRRTRVGATVATALAYPLLLSGTQVYPDIAGGILLLGVATWWIVPSARRSPRATLLMGIGASLVPWLGSRFVLPGVIAVLALIWTTRSIPRFRMRIIVPVVASGAALLGYHLWAFGDPLGPPTTGALAFGREFFLLLPGLILDQNQGPVWANPVLWLAIPGVVLLWRSERALAVLWGALVVALWLPAAAHPGLYGLGSFNGRYSWPIAILAFLPAVLALGALARRTPRAFWAIVSGGVAFQSYLLVLSVFIGGSAPGSPAGLDLYARPAGTWLESYSAWWFPLQRLLPAWYDESWAFAYPQNWVWIAISVVLFGSFLVMPSRRIVGAVGAVALGTLAAAAALGQPGERVSELREGVVLIAERNVAGYPVIGPSELMRAGEYGWFVDYAADSDDVVGKWELVRVADDVVIAAGELAGTGGNSSRLDIPIVLRSLEPREFTLRVGWYGKDDTQIRATGVRFVGLGS